MQYLRWLALLFVIGLVGCGGGPESVTPPEITPTEEIRTILEPVADSGQMGSEIGRLMEQIALLKETDASLASTLEADASKLMEQMSDPSQMQKTAQEMLGKLP